MSSRHFAEGMRRGLCSETSMTDTALPVACISMLVGKFRSLGDAGLQPGNSETVIRKFYLYMKSKEEAGEFWNICPAPIEGEKVVQFRG